MSDPNRRTFLKSAAMASAAAAASSLMPGIVFGEAVDAYAGSASSLRWKKAPCRFCGVGCGLLIGIEDGEAVAVRGDPDSPVNKGLACVRGYHSIQALYGRDRVTRAMVRRNGRLVEVPLEEALDHVAERLRETQERHGKDSVAMYGSGQGTISQGYAASKLFKGGLGTNNLDTNVRLYEASAMTGLIGSFGADQPMGCYEDIDHADVFVVWGHNIAEDHPVLFSRMLERRRRDGHVRIIDLSTRTTRTSYAADRSFIYAPQSDLAVVNAICQEIVDRGRANRDFLERHVAFKSGKTEIGYGLTGDVTLTDRETDTTWEEYVRFLSEYTPEQAARLSGVPAADIRWLASLYGDPSLKVTSFWCVGANRHTRGTWMNNLLYNLHLLTGKVSAPGNSPFALSEQPSGSGSVREVGALPDRLPRGVVTSEEDRQRAAEIWDVPVENLNPEPGPTALEMFRALGEGEIRFMWIQASNPMVSLPHLRRYRAAAEAGDSFLVVSEAYPTPTLDVADVVLPAAMWIEQEGLYGNSERRIQHFERMLEPPGEAISDTEQLVEVARRLGLGDLFPGDSEDRVGQLWAEYVRFHDVPEHRMPPLSELRSRPGLMWPYVDGTETKWRYNGEHDPAADPAQGEFDFYATPDHRARIWLRPYEPPAERPDQEFPFWLEVGQVLEHWHTGSMTRRIPTLHRAVPRGYAELNRQDARDLGIHDGEYVRLVTRRGTMEIEARIDYRSQPARGRVFVPFFDEAHPVNELTLDACCPISGQPDSMKCAVRLEPLGPGQER